MAASRQYAADYYVAPQDLEDSLLGLSTLENPHATKEDRRSFPSRVTCLFCGHQYKYGPQNCEVHLDGKLGKNTTGIERKVSACVPTFQHNVRFKEVLDEMRKRRREEESAKKRKVMSQGGNVEGTGSPQNPIELHDGGGGSKKPSILQPVTREEMNMAWAMVIAKCGLSLRLVDDPHFRQALVATALCGQQAVRNVSGEGKDTTLPRRTTYATRLIPQLDKDLDERMGKRMHGLVKKYGATYMSDGTSSVSKRPIVNLICSSHGYHTLVESFDASGQDKTMAWLAAHIIRVIKIRGEGDVFGVCTDGACKGAFTLIRDELPWTQCYTCVAHAVDLFLKNICSSNEDIRMQANEMGGFGRAEMEWNEPLFKNTFEEVHICVKAVTAYQKPFARFRFIALELLKSGELDGGTEPLKFGPTRFGSKVLMAERFLKTRMIYEKLMLDAEFVKWLDKQSADVKAKVRVYAYACVWARVCVRECDAIITFLPFLHSL
jgi:Protein of unknown function (DUF 659)